MESFIWRSFVTASLCAYFLPSLFTIQFDFPIPLLSLHYPSPLSLAFLTPPPLILHLFRYLESPLGVLFQHLSRFCFQASGNNGRVSVAGVRARLRLRKQISGATKRIWEFLFLFSFSFSTLVCRGFGSFCEVQSVRPNGHGWVT